MSLSLTLAVLKPDLVLHPMHLSAVRRVIVESKFWVVRRFQLLALDKKFVLFFFSSLVALGKEQAEAFYAEHAGKFFHQRLVEHMTSGPCQPLILAKVWRTLDEKSHISYSGHKENAIKEWRSLMGPPKVFQAR